MILRRLVFLFRSGEITSAGEDVEGLCRGDLLLYAGEEKASDVCCYILWVKVMLITKVGCLV